VNSTVIAPCAFLALYEPLTANRKEGDEEESEVALDLLELVGFPMVAAGTFELPLVEDGLHPARSGNDDGHGCVLPED
jgi:hypothetical protein